MKETDRKLFERVESGLDGEENGDPFKDFCSHGDLYNAATIMLNILDARIPNWREKIELNDDGTVKESTP